MDTAETPNTAQDLKQVLGRAMVIAHLITESESIAHLSTIASFASGRDR
jgi:hypothetical protein